ncbi:MAG: divergent polysaccharide deacetylase family protein [Chitinispirillaceae bacterium]|nr:divergent polysaccharide deacetylase family protein [Chitinispirillaceae bacterium]
MRNKLLLSALGVVLVGAGAWYLFQNGMPQTDANRQHTVFLKDSFAAAARHRPLLKLENNILDLLAEIEIAESTVVSKMLPGDSVREMHSFFPQGRPLEWIIWHVSGAVQGTRYRIEDCYARPDGRTCIIRFASTSPLNPPVVLTLRRSSRYMSGIAKMAIVITNVHFASDRLRTEYLSFPGPLTLSLLPLSRNASWTDGFSSEHAKEIIILLPMEPAKPIPASIKSSRLMLHYPDDRVRSIINSAASSIPSCSGFSNWGGSRILQDSRILGIVFSEIKKQGGFFIERLETKESIAMHLARKQGIRAAVIDHVIDSSLSRSAIATELMHYAAYAHKRGSCILESSPTARFLEALAGVRAALSRNGVELVYVSDIIPSMPR